MVAVVLLGIRTNKTIILLSMDVWIIDGAFKVTCWGFDPRVPHDGSREGVKPS